MTPGSRIEQAMKPAANELFTGMALACAIIMAEVRRECFEL
jgi:hypothetical protein